MTNITADPTATVLFEQFFVDSRDELHSAGCDSVELRQFTREFTIYLNGAASIHTVTVVHDRHRQEVLILSANGNQMLCVADRSVLVELCAALEKHGATILYI